MNFFKKPKTFFLTRAMWVITFAVLSFIYYHVFHLWPHNSDDANSLLAGYDIFNGNPLLKGWYLPSDSFYATDVLALGFLTLILGLSPTIMLIWPAMVWSAVVMVSATCAMRYSTNRNWAILCIVAVLGFPVLASAPAMELIAKAPMHIATTLYALFLILMAHRWLNAKEFELPLFFAFSLLLAITVISDPFILFVCALPILLVCAQKYVDRLIRPRAITLAATVMVGIVLGKIVLLAVNYFNGFKLNEQPMVFAPFSGLEKNFSFFTHGVLALFGADFTGRELIPKGDLLVYLTQGPLVMLARLPFLVAVIWAVYVTARSIIKVREVPLIALLLFYPIVTITAATLLSNQLVDISSARYCFPILIFGMILFVVISKPTIFVMRASLAMSVICAIYFCATYVIASQNQVIASPEQERLAQWLDHEGMTRGYAPYWSASILTVLTRGRVEARALVPNGSGLSPFRWLAKEEWYGSPSGPVFVIFDPRVISLNYERMQIISSFGQPDQTHQVGPYEILTYRHSASINATPKSSKPFTAAAAHTKW